MLIQHFDAWGKLSAACVLVRLPTLTLCHFLRFTILEISITSRISSFQYFICSKSRYIMVYPLLIFMAGPQTAPASYQHLRIPRNSGRDEGSEVFSGCDFLQLGPGCHRSVHRGQGRAGDLARMRWRWKRGREGGGDAEK